jgi:aspartyl-tRNA(Asn)/glutamyl-tRNA(Gln) amidotransferase subunit B
VERIRAALPEAPSARRARLRAEWDLSESDMTALSNAGALDLVAETVAAGTLNDKLARQVIDAVLDGAGDPDEVVQARNLAVISDEGALTAAVDEAIAANPDVVARIRTGKTAAAGVLVGAVMKATRGQADAARVRELILERLS